MAFHDLEAEVAALKARQEGRARDTGGRPVQISVSVETRRVTLICADCKKGFKRDVTVMDGRPIGAVKVCDPCVELRNADAAKTLRRRTDAERSIAWREICPPDYMHTDLSRLEAVCMANGVSKADIQRILNWPLTELGLGLIGETGHCKTRLMFLLMERYHMEGAKIVHVNGAQWGVKLSKLFSNRASHAWEYIDLLRTAEVLFIDDLGKGTITERVEEALYDITENRKANRRPFFYTSNMTGKELIAKMTKDGFVSDRAEPTVRRIREMCTSMDL